MAIDQLQIANTVVNTAFMLILGGLALALGKFCSSTYRVF